MLHALKSQGQKAYDLPFDLESPFASQGNFTGNLPFDLGSPFDSQGNFMENLQGAWS